MNKRVSHLSHSFFALNATFPNAVVVETSIPQMI